jgi:thioredoxin-like negative regulator of GroEL
MLKISDDMQEIINQDNAIVAFTASWCQPCKALKPQFAKAAVIDKDTPYYVVDVDNIGSEYINQYGIQSIPQVFEINKGVVVKKIFARTVEEIVEEVHKINEE